MERQGCRPPTAPLCLQEAVVKARSSRGCLFPTEEDTFSHSRGPSQREASLVAGADRSDGALSRLRP